MKRAVLLLLALALFNAGLHLPCHADTTSVSRQLAPQTRGFWQHRTQFAPGGQPYSDMGRIRAERYMKRAQIEAFEGPVTIQHQDAKMHCRIDADGYLLCD